MNEIKVDFEQFLSERFANEYSCAKGCFDDAFQEWLLVVPRENIIEWADDYARSILK